MLNSKIYKLCLVVINVTISVIVSTSFVLACGQGGVGNCGGGRTVKKITGQVSLKDFVDKTNCQWNYGEELASKLEYFDSVINKIKSLHWTFGKHIENEIKSLKFCTVESRLKNISVEDSDSLAIPQKEGDEFQMGIRLGDEVHLSGPAYRELPPKMRPWALVHEAMHKFIPQNAEKRNTKLRSLVKFLASEEANKENIPLNLEKAEIDPMYVCKDSSPTDFGEKTLFYLSQTPYSCVLWKENFEEIELLLKNKSEQTLVYLLNSNKISTTQINTFFNQLSNLNQINLEPTLYTLLYLNEFKEFERLTKEIPSSISKEFIWKLATLAESKDNNYIYSFNKKILLREISSIELIKEATNYSLEKFANYLIQSEDPPFTSIELKSLFYNSKK